MLKESPEEPSLIDRLYARFRAQHAKEATAQFGVEVTPAMIKAGSQVLSRYHSDLLPNRELDSTAVNVYAAMRRAQLLLDCDLAIFDPPDEPAYLQMEAVKVLTKIADLLRCHDIGS